MSLHWYQKCCSSCGDWTCVGEKEWNKSGHLRKHWVWDVVSSEGAAAAENWRLNTKAKCFSVLLSCLKAARISSSASNCSPEVNSRAAEDVLRNRCCFSGGDLRWMSVSFITLQVGFQLPIKNHWDQPVRPSGRLSIRHPCCNYWACPSSSYVLHQ